jgi:hypothetical protein
MENTNAEEPNGESKTTDAFEDLIAALLFMVIGGVAFVIASGYELGTLRRLGPGAFPMLVSGLLVIIGLALATQVVLAGKLKNRPSLKLRLETVRALFFIMASLFAFALLVRPAGLFIATALQVFIVTRAEPGRPVVPSVILAVSVASVAALIFIYGIGLPIPLWPV